MGPRRPQCLQDAVVRQRIARPAALLPRPPWHWLALLATSLVLLRGRGQASGSAAAFWLPLAATAAAATAAAAVRPPWTPHGGPGQQAAKFLAKFLNTAG